MERTFYTLSNYCSEKEFITALQNISDDLSVVNLPPIPKYNKEEPGITISCLINTVWTLLQQRQQFVDNQHNLEQKIYALSQDLNYHKVKQKKTEKNLLDYEDSSAKEKNKILRVEMENTQLLQDSKYLKKEIQELKQQTRSREIQFKHDLQRQNIEISELQSKLRKILSKEKGEIWKGPAENSAKYKVLEEDKIKGIESLYQKSIHRLENNVHTLVKENLDLRKLLDNVSEDLAQLMAQTTLHDCKDPG